jgi:ribosome-binding protein aMBF1 (putative translation factor)
VVELFSQDYNYDMARSGRRAASPALVQRGRRLAHVLRDSRDARDWSRPELARAAQVEADTLRRIESGQTHDPGFFTVVDLARALGLNLAELADHTLPPDASGEVLP